MVPLAGPVGVPGGVTTSGPVVDMTVTSPESATRVLLF
jgi:hypothetical protein